MFIHYKFNSRLVVDEDDNGKFGHKGLRVFVLILALYWFTGS